MTFDPITIVAIVIFGMTSAYLVVAIFAVVHFRFGLTRERTSTHRPPVTVLKPLCGDEIELAENLRSFCRQDYPEYQVVFGVRDAADPAVAIVKRIIAEFPDKDCALVVDDRMTGSNLKVNNLINMFPSARHDIIVVADSDMRVDPTYLDAVVAPFAEPKVGATTCLYSGSPRGGVASKLGAMFINDWFLPSALIPNLFGGLSFCFGATMAVRRKALVAFGGFEALANILADDYLFGNLVSRQGYKIALVPYVVTNIVHEANMKALVLHEMRWARTIRSVQASGYLLSTVTEALPLALLASMLLYTTSSSALFIAGPLICAISLRLALHGLVSWTLKEGGIFMPWLVPLRDTLSFAVRIRSFFGSEVHWREQVMSVRSESRLLGAE